MSDIHTHHHVHYYGQHQASPSELSELTNAVHELRRILMPLSPNIQALVTAVNDLTPALTTFLSNQDGANAAAIAKAIADEDTDPALVQALTDLTGDVSAIKAKLPPAVSAAGTVASNG